jgi:hypothetical protein
MEDTIEINLRSLTYDQMQIIYDILYDQFIVTNDIELLDVCDTIARFKEY